MVAKSRSAPLIPALENVVKAMAERANQQVDFWKKAQGDMPAGAVKLSEDDQAKRMVPSWHTTAQQQGPDSQAFYADLVKNRGPKAALAWERRARKLYYKYPHYAALYRGEEDHKAYEMARGTGAHTGRVGPTLRELIEGKGDGTGS